MLLSSILLVPGVVHAGTGLVSVNNGNQIISAQLDTAVSVPINIAGSDALNGFDIQVFANPTILSAASVSLATSVVTSPTIVIECINGVLVAGSTCAPQDASGVVHLAAAHIGALTTAPTSGLLFTINYKIVGHTPSTSISFNTGCSGTSVAGDCVTISNGSPTPVPETDLGATYANLNDFTMTPAFAKISTTASASISDVINYAAKGVFSSDLTETVTGPCTLATNTVSFFLTTTGSDTLKCSSTTNGDFSVTVTATGGGVTHFTTIALHVGPAGFSSTLNQATVTISRGNSDSTTIVTLTGVSGFSGSMSITAAGPSGITGSASPAVVTLAPDASGYSLASSVLTVTVASSVVTGIYSLTVTGGAALSVNVPNQDFTIGVGPAGVTIPRGGSVTTTITLTSVGNFAGTVTLTAAITVNGVDPGTGVTNNIAPSFLPASVTLTAGGSAQAAFFAGTVKIGTSPNPANTATGNYTATITGTSGSSSHPAVVTFNVIDFSLGPTFCSGNTPILTSPADSNFFPVFVGEQCNTMTLTTQTEANGGAPAILWMQVSSLGGLVTNGGAPSSIAGVNPTGPGRGVFVPELGHRACILQTFFANGTQASTSYLRFNGPVVRPGTFSGCRFDAAAFPSDVANFPATNNVDFFAVTASALTNTLPGTYFVNVCGEQGSLLNCQMITLIVVQAPKLHQFVYSHTVSFSSLPSGALSFKMGLSNYDTTTTLLVQVTITGTGSLGDSFTVTSAVLTIPALTDLNNIVLSTTLTRSEIGETFIWSTSIAVSATDAGALTGTSTLATTQASASFTLVH
jgi:hypothetical protein